MCKIVGKAQNYLDRLVHSVFFCFSWTMMMTNDEAILILWISQCAVAGRIILLFSAGDTNSNVKCENSDKFCDRKHQTQNQIHTFTRQYCPFSEKIQLFLEQKVHRKKKTLFVQSIYAIYDICILLHLIMNCLRSRTQTKIYAIPIYIHTQSHTTWIKFLLKWMKWLRKRFNRFDFWISQAK